MSLNTRNYIKVDGKYYDPYYILGVSKTDEYKQVKKAFKERALLIHPDKKKYKDIKVLELHFEILKSSYIFIKNRLVKETRLDDTPKERKNNTTSLKERKNDISSSPKERKDITFKNLFDGKKFCIERFNDIFDYYLDLNDDQAQETSVIKCVNDKYNSNALVASYNGLMISGDIEPSQDIIKEQFKYKLPENIDENIVYTRKRTIKDKKDILKREKTINIKGGTKLDYMKSQFDIEIQKSKEYKKKIEKDKELVIQSGVYSNNMIENASSGLIETSKDYIPFVDDTKPFTTNTKMHFRLT